ncbi:hypothetical protein C8Q78DRAFT_1082815 [Trametes maxima]|nr:hypothetical protein C8Q78DRAFT_1082815 [Trametes maxima]
MGNLTKKQLESLVENLQRDIESLTLARSQVDNELQAARETIREQIEALEAARAVAATAREEVTAANTAREALETQLTVANAAAARVGNTQPVATADEHAEELAQIARPPGSGWSIREAMDVDRVDYADIQRTVRSLVIRSQLDWTEDFRRQDADKMATMFRAARKAHPVLRRYIGNWATAAIAKQYMQNKRKHAYKQGYIKKRSNTMDGCNPRRRDDDESMGGASGGLGMSV